MLADLFKRKRTEQGCTQAELAEKLGSSQEWVSKNERKPSKSLAMAIAYVLELGISKDDLNDNQAD